MSINKIDASLIIIEKMIDYIRDLSNDDEISVYVDCIENLCGDIKQGFSVIKEKSDSLDKIQNELKRLDLAIKHLNIAPVVNLESEVITGIKYFKDNLGSIQNKLSALEEIVQGAQEPFFDDYDQDIKPILEVIRESNSRIDFLEKQLNFKKKEHVAHEENSRKTKEAELEDELNERLAKREKLKTLSIDELLDYLIDVYNDRKFEEPEFEEEDLRAELRSR
jgi:hypothetical protein